MIEPLKRAFVWLRQLVHWHVWWSKEVVACRFVDMHEDIWPMRAPYLEICTCGATRLKETRPHE